MAFVNERMTKEEKEAFKERKIPAPTWPLRVLEPGKWTVDHERDIFLVWGSQLREEDYSNSFFVLGWKGTYIQMKLKETFVGKNAQCWSFVKFDLPKELKEYQEQIITDLKDALTIYGYDGDPFDSINKIITVTFDF